MIHLSSDNLCPRCKKVMVQKMTIGFGSQTYFICDCGFNSNNVKIILDSSRKENSYVSSSVASSSCMGPPQDKTNHLHYTLSVYVT